MQYLVSDIMLTWKASIHGAFLPWSVTWLGKKWNIISGCSIPGRLRANPPDSKWLVAVGPVINVKGFNNYISLILQLILRKNYRFTSVQYDLSPVWFKNHWTPTFIIRSPFWSPRSVTGFLHFCTTYNSRWSWRFWPTPGKCWTTGMPCSFRWSWSPRIQIRLVDWFKFFVIWNQKTKMNYY